ncbi:hypothetical protein [Herbidospora mongoliensis]|uniref:hypothetical protein n=1 Tax=Herbidospora mongoliensis TaxID=688067 RepID=UPI000836A75C|nr:hypothetical protein [Herbidospora mongoliensis]
MKRLTAAFAAAITLVVVPVPAEAATARCVLNAERIQGVKMWLVRNNCTPADPSDRIAQTIFWGADWPDLDDYLGAENYPTMNNRLEVSWASLNEDALTGDEVYTENRFVRTNGSIYTVKSNEVKKEFLL